MKNVALLFIGIASLTAACQGEAVYADPDPNETDGANEADGNHGANGSVVTSGGEGFAAAATVSGNIATITGTTSTTTGGVTPDSVDGAGGATGNAVSASGADNLDNTGTLDPDCAADVAQCWNSLPSDLYSEEKCRAMHYACRGLEEVCSTQFLFDQTTPPLEELCDAAAGGHERTRHSYGLDSTGTHITCCWLEPK